MADTASASNQSTDVGEFLRLIHNPGDVFEIRIPNTPDRRGGTFKATASGYFDDIDRAVAYVNKWSAVEPAGIYATINPVARSLLARSANKITFRAKNTTADCDVDRRRWLFLDIDPIRPAGISASDEEATRAAAKQRDIREWLMERGWPEPVRMMSGNGAYLFYQVSIDNDQFGEALVKDFINAIADEFTDEFVEVDRSVYNASRIAKIGGTWARKGDSVDDRPHRQSFFVPPDEIQPVSSERVRAVIDEIESARAEQRREAEKREQAQQEAASFEAEFSGTEKVTPGNQMQCQRYVDKIEGAVQGKKGSNQTIKVACVIARFGLDEELGWPIMQTFNNRCSPPWEEHELRRKLQEGIRIATEAGEFGKFNKTGCQQPEDAAAQACGLTVAELIEQHPNRRPELIEGLLRRGEVMNIIGAPKEGKSWFVYNLAFCLATGREWLGRETQASRILLIDNEIHIEELAFRLAQVATALRIPPPFLAEAITVESRRGKLSDISTIEALVAGYAAEESFDLIIIDAFYRTLPEGTSENDNAQMTAIYNRIDQMASHASASVVLNHHSSKGDQSHKGVTDVGSGAGAMTRAVDTHITIRPHELDSCAVLEAVCRSNRKPEPSTICFEFPTWSAKHIEPALRQPVSAADRRRERENEEADEEVLNILSDRAEHTQRDLLNVVTFGRSRLESTLKRLIRGGEIAMVTKRESCTGRQTKFYSVNNEVKRESCT